jgi:chromosome segregation ATPase
MVVGCGLAIPRGQQSTQVDPLTQSVQEMTRELRSLRVAVEQSAQGQLQAQVLGLYITLQQQRVALAAGRLDAVRRELETVGNQSGELGDRVGTLESRIPLENDAERRRQLEREYGVSKQLIDRLAGQESRIKSREAELHQAAQTEELQWRDLVSRLERLLKK